MGIKLFLELVSEGISFPPVSLTPGVTLVGRSSGCRVRLTDPTVSRRHAKVSVHDDVIDVADLGSRNGTFVDEVPVKFGRIGLGQRLRFGAVLFRVSSDEGRDHDESGVETEDAKCASQMVVTSQTAVGLSPAQQRVLELLLGGFSEKDVAMRLALSRHTVHNHAKEIYRAFDVHSRAELLARALDQNAGKGTRLIDQRKPDRMSHPIVRNKD